MPRTGRELAVAQSPQLAAQRLLRDRDAELLPDPGDEIDKAPAHQTVNRRDRPRVDDVLQGLALLTVQKRAGARRPAGHESLRPRSVEAQHPVAHNLQRDAADPRCLGACRPIVDRRQASKRRV